MALEMATSSRRSRAVGWRRAMMVHRSLSISTSIALTRSSATSTCAAVSWLRCVSAYTAWPTWDSTRPPISSTRVEMALSSASNCEDRCLSVMANPFSRSGR